MGCCQRRYHGWVLTASELLQLLLQGDGGVVGTEHLGRESVHQLLQVLVQDGSLEEENML